MSEVDESGEEADYISYDINFFTNPFFKLYSDFLDEYLNNDSKNQKKSQKGNSISK
jgi:hypothetical protein